jgi:transposase-like protein
MGSCRPALFRKRQFEPAVIVTCVRWYPAVLAQLAGCEELMAERNLTVDHTTVWRLGSGICTRNSEAITGPAEVQACNLVHG